MSMTHISLGLDLDGWFSEAVVGTTELDGSFNVARAWQSEAPNICVLPRFPVEKPRTSWSAIRTHWARGSGFPYSPDARELLARLPSWLTWLALGLDVVEPRLQLTYADGQCKAFPLRSVLRTHAEALDAAECKSPTPSAQMVPALHVVAIPEHFQERAQENLLASLRHDRGEVRLLWESVALCLAWIATLSPSLRSRYVGKRVAVVDVGVAEVSAAVLQLHSRSRDALKFLIPKRDLPESGSSCRWPILPFDLCVAAKLLESLGEPYGMQELWQVACGGATASLTQPVTEDAREAVSLVKNGAGWRRLDLSSDRLKQAVAAAATCSRVNGLDDLWNEVRRVLPDSDLGDADARKPVAQILAAEVADWLRCRPEQPDVVLLTGPVMRLAVAPNETLGSRMARSLRVSDACVVLVDGQGLSPSVSAAHGCAIYGGRELANLPTYLDTLPRFCIVGKDRLRWKDVYYDLVPHSEWEGGKEYRPNEEELDRLRDAAFIPTGRRRVRFRLRRQDEEKHLEQDFEQAPLRDCKLSFDVRLRPAQGFARVKIIPEQVDLFGGRDVELNWDRMGDAKIQAESPPDFPPCAPLDSNPSRIQNYAAPALEDYVEAVEDERWVSAAEKLRRVGQQLQSGGAYGSEPVDFAIHRLTTALTRHQKRYVNLKVYDALRARDARQRDSAMEKVKDLMRAATGLFTKTPDWACAWVEDAFQAASRLRPEDPNPPPVVLNAAGRCFSSAAQVRLFVNCFGTHLHQRIQRWKQRSATPGMSNWCKAFQMILRLQEEAVLHFEREQADSVASDLCDLLDAVQAIDRRGLNLRAPYKHAIFCIYFLLRFRVRSDGADFLGDWSRRGTSAHRIHGNLSRHRDVGARRQLNLLSNGRNETIQATLLRFLESKATVQDIVIMKDAHDATLDEADDEDG